MPHILNGKEVRDEIAQRLSREIVQYSSKPMLVIIQVGDRPDSTAYIRQKRLFAEKIGALILHAHYANDVEEKTVLGDILKYNADASVHGIIVQLPLPPHLEPRKLIEAIDPKKDVDGLTSFNTKLLYDNHKEGFMPATARGVLALLEHNQISIEGKRVVVVGRSALVGKPTAIAFLNKNATVTVAHRHTTDLPRVTREAEILVVAIGQPEFITHEYVSAGAVVVDIGINSIIDNAGVKKTVGDVKFADVAPHTSAISPVPGGVGPMTVASLFLNLIQAYRQQQ